MKVSHLFEHPDVIDFTRSVLQSWQPTGKPILFVPCSKSKPIQESVSHKQLFHRFRDNCDLLILSEPMTIIPYSRYDYPDYNYPPGALWRIKGQADIFKARLKRFLIEKELDRYSCYFLTPHHHLMILWPAWRDAFGSIRGLHGYGYTYATRWFFVEKLVEDLEKYPRQDDTHHVP